MIKPSLILILMIAVTPGRPSLAQNPPPPDASFNADAERQAAGDQPDDPGPLATDLSPKLTRADILKAMKKVADWQLKESESRYNIGWTFAALYDGMLAASKAIGDSRYHDRVFQIAEENHWTLGPRFAHADDYAIGLTHLAFYAEKPTAH